MTIKDRKINVYLNRVKRFNELCPKNGFYWGGLPITPITDRNIKSKLREMEEDEIGRKLQWLERGIKLLEGQNQENDGRKKLLPELKRYLARIEKGGKVKISPSVKVFLVNTGLRASLSLLKREGQKWILCDYRGTRIKMKMQETTLQKEILFRLKARFDPSILPNRKTVFRAYD